MNEWNKLLSREIFVSEKQFLFKIKAIKDVMK